MAHSPKRFRRSGLTLGTADPGRTPSEYVLGSTEVVQAGRRRHHVLLRPDHRPATARPAAQSGRARIRAEHLPARTSGDHRSRLRPIYPVRRSDTGRALPYHRSGRPSPSNSRTASSRAPTTPSNSSAPNCPTSPQIESDFASAEAWSEDKYRRPLRPSRQPTEHLLRPVHPLQPARRAARSRYREPCSTDTGIQQVHARPHPRALGQLGGTVHLVTD